MRRSDRIILTKIQREIIIGIEMLGDMKIEEFLQNEMLKRALSMTVINIGELVKNISDELRKEQSDIPWKAIAGMRDIAAHKYQTLRMEDVYLTIKNDFPKLYEQLRGLS